ARRGRSDPPPAVGAPVSPDAAPRAASRPVLPPAASAALPASRKKRRLDPASRRWSRGNIPRARAPPPPPQSLFSSARPLARAGLREDAFVPRLARRQPGEA